MPYPARPLPADYVRSAMMEIVRTTPRDFPVDRGVLGAFIGVVNRFVGGDANRRAILGYLFRDGREPLSTSDISGPEWNALRRWSKITKMPDSGKWVPADPHFITELQYVAAAANVLFDAARDNPPANPEPPAGFGVDPIDGDAIKNFRAYADQLELFIYHATKESV